jgi:hypothetical protein
MGLAGDVAAGKYGNIDEVRLTPCLFSPREANRTKAAGRASSPTVRRYPVSRLPVRRGT